MDSLQSFARQLARADPSLDAIQLEGLDPGDSQFRALVDGFRSAGWVTKPYFGWGTWFERTRGIAFGEYLLARPSILQNTWKRKGAALQKSAKWNIRMYAVADDLDIYIDAYERVRERSWKEPEPFPAFIPGVIRLAAAHGALRFGILDIDGRPAAAQFWLVWGRRATIFKLVYAEDYSMFSPGTLLTMRMMEAVLENDRPDEINFGRGDDPYKKMWLSSRRERWGIEAANPRTLRGLARAVRLAGGLGRDYMRDVLRVSNAPKLR